MRATKDNLINGHNISHPLINTDEAKRKGWGEVKIEESPFFTTKQDEAKYNEINSHVKSLLDSLFNRIHSCDAPKTESKKEEVH